MFASLAGPLVGCGGSIPEGASASPGGQAVSEVRPVRPERDSLHHNDEPQGHGLGTWTLPEMRTEVGAGCGEEGMCPGWAPASAGSLWASVPQQSHLPSHWGAGGGWARRVTRAREVLPLFFPMHFAVL